MVNPVTRLPALRPVPIFRGLSKAALLQVARKSAEVSYPPGAVVVRQGDPGDSLCIIVSGTVEVRHDDQVVAVLSKGNFFGEIALFDGKPRTASVIAVDDVVVLTLRARDFDNLLNDPYVARAALKSLAERFRSCQNSLSATEV